uniref:Uncharacterized protein n=1 Tax=Grammatophora oceanica TaxID=210454 RepID=A0A7S1YMZ0_9STRA
MVDGEVYEPLNDDSKVVFSVGGSSTSTSTNGSTTTTKSTSNLPNNTIRMEWSGRAVHETSPERCIQFRVAMPVKLNFDWQLEIIQDGDIHVESPGEIEDETFMLMQLNSHLDQLDEHSPILTLYDCGTGDKLTCYRGTSTVGTPVLFVEAFYSLVNNNTSNNNAPQRISQKGMEASDGTLVRVRCDEKDMVVTPGQMLVMDEVKKLFRSFFLSKVVVDPNICMAEIPMVPMGVASVTKSKTAKSKATMSAMAAHAPMEMMQE